MLHSICQQIWKTQQWPQDWKRSVFIPIPKKGKAKDCSNYCTSALISHTNKIMLKILQVRLQQYMNWELPDVQAGFRKDIEIKCQCLLDHGKSKRVSEKHLLMLCWLLQSLWLCGSQQTVKYSSRDGNTRPPYLSPEESVCGQEATVKTRHGTMDWFQIGNEYVKAVYHSVYLTYMQSTSCKMPD